MTEEEVQQMAPGLMQAYAPEEPEENTEGRRPRRRNQDDPIIALRKWVCLLYTSPSPRDRG